MRALSASTRIPDGYRAGLELGTALAALSPEVVFLFTTVHYIDSDAILDGLHDGLEREDVVVVGCCGDGCFETRQYSELGASVLGLNSGGTVGWHLGVAGGVGATPADTTRTAIARATAPLEGRTPRLLYLLSDFRTDAAEIEHVLEHEVDVPVVGGMAFDDGRLEHCIIYAGRQRLHDHVLVLAVDGPLEFEIHVANSIPAVGQAGLVEEACGTTIHRISGMKAQQFMEMETGQVVLRSDPGSLALTLIDSDDSEVRRVRSVSSGFSSVDLDSGDLALYGSITVGKRVQPCKASPEDLLNEVQHLAERVHASGFQPAAVLMTSCAGRKQLLGQQIGQEAHMLVSRLNEVPMAGFPSAGELGPVRTSHGYSRNLFHNMSCIFLLIRS